jgi:hypothetical protein
VSAPELTALQATLRERVVALLAGAGLEPVVKEKVETVEDPETGPSVERNLCVEFALGLDDFELWLYADSAGVLEPPDDWWPFDAADFESAAELAAAVVEHLEDLLDEAGSTDS